VAVGLALSATGDAIEMLLILRSQQAPDVSIADVFWVASYVALGLGLIVRAGPVDRRGREVDSILESATVAIVGLTVIWYFVVGPTFADGTTPYGVRLVWSAYPVLDVWMLSLVVNLMGRRGRATAGLFALGIACWLAADFGYLVTASPDNYSVLLDLGWMSAAVVLGAAAWARSPRRDSDDRPARDSVSHLRLVAVMAPLLVPGIVEVWGRTAGVYPDPVPLALATLALVIIVYLRGARLIAAGAAARERIRAQWHYFESLANTSSDAILIVDARGRACAEPLSLSRLIPSAPPVPEGSDVIDILHPADPSAVERLLSRATASPGTAVTSELELAAEPLGRRWLMARAVDMSADPQVGGIVVNLTDVTSRKEAEQQLEHQALHDGLTGLANRTLLRDRLDQAIRRASRRRSGVAVVWLDLDRFKTINDSLGHDAGDRLLFAVAGRLLRTVRSQDTVARIGGDEFAVVIEESASIHDETNTICDRILQAISEPIELGGRQVLVTASLGAVISNGQAAGADLLRDADVAMYRAKAAGRNRWALHDPDMQNEVDEQLLLEIDLFDALALDQFELHYQPVVRLESEEIIGFEALLRWRHPTLGLIGPDRFIPIAEESGLIIPIGRWVLDKACECLASWHRRQPESRGLTMAVNVSARQLASGDLLDHVREALERHGVSQSTLVLEMTETALVEDLHAATRALHELHEYGVLLAIDDFGTGYSSLAYLRQFPVDILKIDRSFIGTITDAARLPNIVRGLLDLSKTLHLAAVAEGIEDDIQYSLLRAGDCEMGQGYLFAKPLTASDADELVTSLYPGTPATLLR